ncbi:hypothetical protein [Pseudohongiella acticola]|uniref:hypothetical protein n=1 Tax=Pseudohongiella acticola TaxID=1524254 RepID=UPI0011130695|nr:hypothetical protein [Pseudohongiella acticola]
MIDSIVWPCTVLVVVWWLRTPLSKLLPTLSRFKWRDLEIDLSKEIEKISEETNALSTEKDSVLSDDEVSEIEQLQSEVEEVARVSPPAAITLAWTELEREILTTAHRLGMQSKSRAFVTSHKALNTLVGSEKLSREELRLLKKMQMLRNQAAHHSRELQYLTQDDAVQYLANVLLLINRLRAIDA